MNRKLIFSLSLFGLAMAIGTIYWIPMKNEWMFWLPIFIINAYLIAKKCTEKYFLTGFVVSLANCVWIVLIHFLLFETYMQHHLEMYNFTEQMPMPGHPRMQMLVIGPVIGIVSGLVQGLFAVIATKVVKK